MLARKKWTKAPQAKPSQPIQLDAKGFVHGGHALHAESTFFCAIHPTRICGALDFVLCFTPGASAPLNQDHFGFDLVAYQVLSCTLWFNELQRKACMDNNGKRASFVVRLMHGWT